MENEQQSWKIDNLKFTTDNEQIKWTMNNVHWTMAMTIGQWTMNNEQWTLDIVKYKRKTLKYIVCNVHWKINNWQ